ncbi:unnamed protein product [Phytophthora fragariaefolia]|uniref:Unnamed protein product n=1 Tax=Phytophthora fragariaefolia TaxID=1490495 RepID=A0A9W6Y6S3_9STRA|nr:unnamed protein product [Phytophthora fragariaefolia]
MMRCRLEIEEFAPRLHYIKGEHNVVADALSRLSGEAGPALGKDDAAAYVSAADADNEVGFSLSIRQLPQAQESVEDLVGVKGGQWSEVASRTE